MTLTERLQAIAALLPAKEKARLTARLRAGESIDSRLQEAVQSLARSEGLICSTPAEIAQAKASLQANATPLSVAGPREPSVPENEAKSLAAQLAACRTPQALTTFWRSLTPGQRMELQKAM